MSAIRVLAEALEGERGSLKTIEEARSAAEERLTSSSGAEGKLDTSLLKKPSAPQFGPKLQSGKNYLLSFDDARLITRFNSAVENVDKNIRGLTVDHPEGSIPMEGWWATVKDQMYKGQWDGAADNIESMLKLPGFDHGYSDAEFAKSLRDVLATVR